MRIISGKYKGRNLHPPKNLPVRPTTDFAKTGLFNLLESRFDLSSFNCLDLFSGTGSISFELLSRGAKHVTSVDRDKGCCKFQMDTSNILGIKNFSIIKSDIMIFLNSCNQRFELIFADPPFDATYRNQLVEAVFTKPLLTDSGVFVMEHISKEDYTDLSYFSFKRKYGNVAFTFFSNFDKTSTK